MLPSHHTVPTYLHYTLNGYYKVSPRALCAPDCRPPPSTTMHAEFQLMHTLRGERIKLQLTFDPDSLYFSIDI